MRQIISCLVLFVGTSLLAQQQGQPPPGSTPPTFPQQQVPKEQMPPDQQAPERLSTPEVQRKIQQSLNSEPTLQNTNVGVHVDENSVILTGTVNSEQQHDRAVRIAQPYAGDRKIVDKIKVTQQT